MNEKVSINIEAKRDSSVKAVLDAVEQGFMNIINKADKMSALSTLSFGGMAYSLQRFGQMVVERAAEMEMFKGKLETTLKSATAAQEAINYAVQFAAKTPFDVRGIVEATTQLSIYGANAQRVLPLVADLAAGMSKDLGYTSLVFGKAWSGSLEGFESLRNELGVTTQKLVKYGAVMNTEGGISVKTAADLDKARIAMEKLVKAEFGGSIERQFRTYKGAVSNLEDAFSRLYVALGDRLIPALTTGAQGITKIIEVFESLPDSAKDIIAYSGAVTLLFSGGVSLLGLTSKALKSIRQDLDMMGISWTRNGTIANAQLLGMANNSKRVSQMATIASMGAAAPGGIAPGLLFAGMNTGGKTIEESTRKMSAMQKVAGALKMELGSLPTAFAGIGGIGTVIGIAVAAFAGLYYWEEKLIQIEKDRQKQMSLESKDFQTRERAWKDYVALLNEAGKSQGLVARTSSNVATELKNIQDAIQSVDVVKLREIFLTKGVTREDLSKQVETSKNIAENAQKDAELLEKVKNNKIEKWVPTGEADTEGFVKYEKKKVINLEALKDEEKKRYKEILKDRYNDETALDDELLRRKNDALRKSEQAKGYEQGYRKAFSEPERLLGGMEAREKALKSYFSYADKVGKGEESAYGKIGVLQERMEMIKTQVKINEKEGDKVLSTVKDKFGNEIKKMPTTIEGLLDGIKNLSPKDNTVRQIYENQIDLMLKMRDQKKEIENIITQDTKKSLDERLKDYKKQQTALVNSSKDTAANLYDLSKKELNYLKSIKNGPGESSGWFSGSSKDHMGGSTASYKGTGPKAALQEFQEKYKNNAEFRKEVDEKIESQESQAADKKKAKQSETLTKTKQDLDEWMAYSKLKNEGNLQQQIADIEVASQKIEMLRKRDEIGEKDAQEQIRAYRMQTAELTKQLKDKERESNFKLLETVKEGKGQEIQALEERLEKGEDVQQKIINKVKERLDLTLKGIDEETKKELEKEGYLQAQKDAILLGAQNKKMAAIKSETDYVNGVINKAKQDMQALQARIDSSAGGFKILSAFGSAKGSTMNDVPTVSGFSAHIDVDGKKKDEEKKLSPSEIFGGIVNSTLIPATNNLSTAFSNLAAKLEKGFNLPGSTATLGTQGTGTQTGNTNTQNVYVVNGQSSSPTAQASAWASSMAASVANMQSNGYLAPTQSQSSNGPVNKVNGSSNGFGDLTNLYF